MAIDNPFTITYASDVEAPASGEQVGGASDAYQLHGPYVLDKSFDQIRLVFDVVVVSSSYPTLHALSGDLEAAWRKRDLSLKIDIDGTAWTFTFGTGILNTAATIAKSADPEANRGFSRAYTISVVGELVADGTDEGLRDVEMNVDFEASRQKVVTIRGLYTAASDGTTASAQYLAEFDAVAATMLTGVDAAVTWELVDEQYTPDRNDHLCSFTRQWAQLLAEQTQGTLDDAAIRDHRIVFAVDSSHPGDSAPQVHRMRRVIATYDCAIDIDVGTDLQAVFAADVRPHLVALFNANFTPSIFAVEHKRVGYDETSKRMSVQMTFVYTSEAGGAIVEVTESVAIREQRNVDYTPVHMGDIFAAEADEGFAVRERIAMRTVVALGTKSPKQRIGDDRLKAGWNVIQNTSQVSPRYIGDPETEDQIQQVVLTETIVERFHKRPSGRGGGSLTPGGGN